MSSHNELKKEFKEKLEVLRKKCTHEQLKDWEKGNLPGMLHGQIIEVRLCKTCNLTVMTRTKCPYCKKYVDGKDWISVFVIEKGGVFFNEIETAGRMFFCCKQCIKNYKKKSEEKRFKKIKIIKTRYIQREIKP